MKLFANISTNRSPRLLAVTILISLGFTLVSCGSLQKTVAAKNNFEQTTFATPEEAGRSLQAASKAKDESALAKILGSGSQAILTSGDPTEDAAVLDSFVARYDRMNRWVKMTDGRRFLYIGADNYAFPIPLARNESSQWYFDTKAGADEILVRRIGRNELLAIDACKAIANAEELFFKQAYDGAPQYTPMIVSSPGKRDGLYWGVPEGQNPSPLGRLNDFATEAVSSASGGGRTVFDGYDFRILTEQGEGATGGAKRYVVNGKLIGGFAVIATPVKYRDSGIMTFILSKEGIVYQKDLGEKTPVIAASIKRYDRDSGWSPTE
jgi:Protein of unknown function (DUF2950)